MHPGKHAENIPDAPAHIMGRSGEVVTWGELDERSNRLTQLFWDLGLRGCDLVALLI